MVFPKIVPTVSSIHKSATKIIHKAFVNPSLKELPKKIKFNYHGRGRKGWKSRHSGTVVPAFSGGQTKITMAFGKLGVQHRAQIQSNRQKLRVLSLDKLQFFINRNRLDPSKITIKEICQSGVAGKVIDGVTLIAKGAGSFNSKINIEVTRASASAIAAIEKFGGKVTTVYHDRKIIRAVLNPQKFMDIPKLLIPSGRKMIARFADFIQIY
jgi:large subunit ribosomal protein L15